MRSEEDLFSEFDYPDKVSCDGKRRQCRNSLSFARFALSSS